MGHPQPLEEQGTHIPVVAFVKPETQQQEDGEEQLSERMHHIQL